MWDHSCVVPFQDCMLSQNVTPQPVLHVHSPRGLCLYPVWETEADVGEYCRTHPFPTAFPTPKRQSKSLEKIEGFRWSEHSSSTHVSSLRESKANKPGCFDVEASNNIWSPCLGARRERMDTGEWPIHHKMVWTQTGSRRCLLSDWQGHRRRDEWWRTWWDCWILFFLW